MKKIVLIVTMSLSLWASNVYVKVVEKPFERVYPTLLESMTQNGLKPAAEIDILKRLQGSGLEKKIGSKFNTKNLTAMKSVFACNGGLANAIASSDPQMMAFCPIRITVVEQDGKTTITYVKASSASKTSKAYEHLVALEKKVIKAINADYF